MTRLLPRALALAADSDHNRGRVQDACELAGLEVLELSRGSAASGLFGRRDLAFRLPVGLATWFHGQGIELELAVVPPDWLARLPVEVLGRSLGVVTVAELLSGDVDLRQVRMIKLASAKYRDFAASRVHDLGGAQQAVREARLPAETVLLLADDYLDCDSEYRTFTVGREVHAVSPYLVEGESWSHQLVQHRASFHAQAAAFVDEVLAGLTDDEVPPGAVLDVARLPTGQFCLLEANTSWGAGLYGCDPSGVLRSVLAANICSPGPWRWKPDPGVLQLVRAQSS